MLELSRWPLAPLAPEMLKTPSWAVAWSIVARVLGVPIRSRPDLQGARNREWSEAE
jgi:hypothetical protein